MKLDRSTVLGGLAIAGVFALCTVAVLKGQLALEPAMAIALAAMTSLGKLLPAGDK